MQWDNSVAMLLVEYSTLHSSRGEEVISRRGMRIDGLAEAGDEAPLIDTHCHKATLWRVATCSEAEGCFKRSEPCV